MGRWGRLLSPTVLAACLLGLLPACFFPPWEDRYWVGDDDTQPPADWENVPGGTFDMGSNEQTSEQPIHTVTVPPFEMWRTEVTVMQYGQCVNAGECSDPAAGSLCNWSEGEYEDHPVNCVTWQQAVDFCEWVGGRLPSESEWEHAARSGGQDITYPWGDEEATCDYAVMDDVTHSDGCNTGRTWAVCGKSPDGDTDQGLCDMAGNVWEWVQDWFHSCYNCSQCQGLGGCDSSTEAPDDGSAWEVPAGSYRVERGGGFHYDAEFLRTTDRDADDPGDSDAALGFRCAR